MKTAEKTKITIQVTVNAPLSKVWNVWTTPAEIVKWNSPSPEWHSPRAEHELKAGGTFNYRMEARDGSMGFDFGGVFDVVKPNAQLDYTIGDGRKVTTTFTAVNEGTRIVQTFEAEDQNPIEMQRGGWQAIMDSFKAYTETQG
jgi:uncharacterized protein YndB with AHSA1/START domain